MIPDFLRAYYRNKNRIEAIKDALGRDQAERDALDRARRLDADEVGRRADEREARRKAAGSPDGAGR